MITQLKDETAIILMLLSRVKTGTEPTSWGSLAFLDLLQDPI
jgi:hypothetical protein